MLSARTEETLIVLGFFVALVWTKCRVFSVSLEPLWISFHLFTLWAAIGIIREAR